MTSPSWPDFGPDVDYIRQQMAANPPDDGASASSTIANA